MPLRPRQRPADTGRNILFSDRNTAAPETACSEEAEIALLLKEHTNKYPLLLPQDAYKLLFQREFGPGHMAADPEAVLARLESEYKETEKTDRPSLETIGNGFVRVYLSGLKKDQIPSLGKVFLLSMPESRGSVPGFENSLSVLLEICGSGQLPFETPELLSFLDSIRQEGYPAVSHSDPYRCAYRPSYRVVCERILKEFLRI